MATAQVKRETLKNIGNVQDWALKQRKDQKEVTKPVKPRSSAGKHMITNKAVHTAPAVLVVTKPPVVPQPIQEEVKEPIENGVQSPSTGAKVRRIYSREFLIKFKYSAAPFPPGAQTPLDLINQYNKEFELREQQRMAENSTPVSLSASVLASSVLASTSILPVTHPASTATLVETTAPRATIADKKVKKIKKEGEEKTFKLRLANTDESLLRSPLFRASATKTPIRPQTPPSAIVKGDDKENPVPVKSARSSSVKRQAVPPVVSKKEKETKKAPKQLQPQPTSVAPAPVSTPVIDSFAVPISVAEVTPAHAVVAPVMAPFSVPVEVAKDSATDDASKQDLVDVLSKKLKNALRETDTRRLAQRQKQIDYGKATTGYQDYCKQTAKCKRKREDPKTPNKYQVCSKRSWDGQIRKWRRMLHMYDPVELKEAQAKNPTDGDDVDMIDGKPFSFEITAADVLAEEKALLE